MDRKRVFNNILDKFSGYFLILVTLLMFISFVRSVAKIQKAEGRINTATQRVEEMKSDNYELEKKLEEIKGEEYLEIQLRDKLGLAKEGEIVVVLPDEEYLRKLAPKRQFEEAILPEANWKKWLNLFF